MMEVKQMTFRRASIAVVGILPLMLAGCAGLMGGERRETNAEVILVAFGSANGELAPCG